MYTAGLVGAELQRRWGTAALHAYRARFRSPVCPGDRLTLTAEAVARDAATGLAEVSLAVRKQDGEVVMTAEARILLSALKETGR
jgi:acyl dehydratase